MKKERDLFSIGEVARALNITRRAILYYEEFGLIRPDVKDGATGNRYYTIDTFVKLRTIRILQNLGLSLSDVLGYFDGDFALAPLIRRLEAQRDELDRHIESLRERSGAEPPQVKLIRARPSTRTPQSSSPRYFCRCWSGRGRSTASPPRQNSSHRIPVGCRAPGA